MSGINWIEEITREAPSQPPSQVPDPPASTNVEAGASGPFDGKIKVFRLEPAGYKELKEFNRITIKELFESNLLLKIDELYVAGNEKVFEKIKDKKDKILSKDYFEGPIKELVTAGCTRESIIAGSFYSFLTKKWAHEVFGGVFLMGGGEECLKRSEGNRQISMPT